jgi:hypothetical protein
MHRPHRPEGRLRHRLDPHGRVRKQHPTKLICKKTVPSVVGTSWAERMCSGRGAG